jgi:hypothetical protein
LSDKSSCRKSFSSNSPNYSPQISDYYYNSCTCDKNLAHTSNSSNKSESKTINISFNESDGPTEYRSNRSGRNSSITTSKTIFNHHNNCYCCIKELKNSNENDLISRRHSLNSFQTFNQINSDDSYKLNDFKFPKNKCRSASAKHVVFKNFLKPVVNVSFLQSNRFDSCNSNEEFPREKNKMPFEFKQYAKVTLKNYPNKSVVTSNKNLHRTIQSSK